MTINEIYPYMLHDNNPFSIYPFNIVINKNPFTRLSFVTYKPNWIAPYIVHFYTLECFCSINKDNVYLNERIP